MHIMVTVSMRSTYGTTLSDRCMILQLYAVTGILHLSTLEDVDLATELFGLVGN